MRYAVVIEKAAGNYSAFVPDLPGCVATGATVPQIEAEIREVIRFLNYGLMAPRARRDRHRSICRRVAILTFANEADCELSRG